MKPFFIALSLVLLNSVNADTFDPGIFYPGELANCPMSSETMLEVVDFIPSNSADSRVTKGQCQVKAQCYSWWDLINESQIPDTIVDTVNCNSKDFEYLDGKILIKAKIYYIAMASNCGSNPGCHYECKPVVSVWSL